jgi:cysteine-S-conjugate beta-lyase
MHNFDEIIERRHTNSMKWDTAALRLTPEQCAANPLPMWVADMEFRVAQPIRDAIRRELDHGVLGYGAISARYIDAVLGWQARRFGFHARADWLTTAPGIVNALNMAIQAFTHPGDSVLIQTPVYHHFHHDIAINGRHLAEAPIPFDGDTYRFDAHAFEAAIRPDTKLFILCNPHNPTGNVWSRDELFAMSDICRRHGVLIVSDEVHQDFVFDEYEHVSFGTLGDDAMDNAIICTAPSKTFNIAGLQCANIFISNARLRADYRLQRERCGLNHVNTLGTIACETAYRECENWADAMSAYVRENREYLKREIAAKALRVKVVPAGSLYLAWLDFRALKMPAPELNDFLLRKARLWLDPGLKFGEAGRGFMRINLGCPRSMVEDAIQRLSAALG